MSSAPKAAVKVVALSGSLRAASLNTTVLRAAARIAPPEIQVQLYSGLAELPLFNPDMEPLDPAPVARLRQVLIASDAVLIASPEYAHGMSGVLKNALDWMVGNESFVSKPVALLNISPRATHAQAALRETLLTMSAHVIDRACVVVPLLGSGLGEEGIVGDAQISGVLLGALQALQEAAREARQEGP